MDIIFDKNIFADFISTSFKKNINYDLNENQIHKFFLFANFLFVENKKYNLTAITKMDQIIIKHFLDSCMFKKFFDNCNDKINKIIDVGTGAGFPGIPLAIIYENIDFTLIDSSNKKINFINMLLNIINLKNVKTISCRAEELSKNINYRELYDVGITRAVAKMNILYEIMISFVKIDGHLLLYKNFDIKDEIDQSKNAEKELFISRENPIFYQLQNENINRQIIISKKMKTTPNIYPRRYNQIILKPL